MLDDEALGYKKPKPGYSPVYCALYPDLAVIARKHGYALAIHGSLLRDFDLIAVPWVEIPSDPRVMLKEITETFDIRLIDIEPSMRPHGRMAHTISVAHGECAIDISFMPISSEHKNEGESYLRKMVKGVYSLYKTEPTTIDFHDAMEDLGKFVGLKK